MSEKDLIFFSFSTTEFSMSRNTWRYSWKMASVASSANKLRSLSTVVWCPICAKASRTTANKQSPPPSLSSIVYSLFSMNLLIQLEFTVSWYSFRSSEASWLLSSVSSAGVFKFWSIVNVCVLSVTGCCTSALCSCCGISNRSCLSRDSSFFLALNLPVSASYSSSASTIKSSSFSASSNSYFLRKFSLMKL